MKKEIMSLKIVVLMLVAGLALAKAGEYLLEVIKLSTSCAYKTHWINKR